MKVLYRIIIAIIAAAACYWLISHPFTYGAGEVLSGFEDPVRGRFELIDGGKAREQLSERRQLVYDAMITAADQCSPSVTVPVRGYTSSDIEAALFSLLYDRPEIFWLDFTECSYAFDDRGTTINFTYYYSGEQLERMKKTLDDAVDSIISYVAAKNLAGEYGKAVAVHDYIAGLCEYDRNPAVADTHTAYGALVNNRAVCDGYAHAYQLVMWKLGIECHYVPGEAEGPNGREGHAWNILKLDGVYTAVDLTWDDMDSYLFGDIGVSGDVTSHTFFGLSDEQMKKTHKVDDNYLYPLPEAVENSWFDKNGVSGAAVEIFAENAAVILLENLEKSTPYVEIRITDKAMFGEFMEEYNGDIIDAVNAMLRETGSERRFLNEMKCFVTGADRGCVLILGTLGFAEEQG